MQGKKEIVPKDLHTKFKKLRLTKGWSQGQLAKKLDTDVPRISKYETGAVCPTVEMIIKLADIFEVSLDYLLRNESNVSISKITNRELLKKVHDINELSDDDQKTLISVLDAFIKRHRLEGIGQRDV
ncbi:MAG: helix-turn-helix domain-containing protein [Proteobacteria bacterium]|nr:helix-turn-helix domain-containing protein [Pseudomonadota bacterium]